MDHLAYYNEGCEPDAGESGLMVWTRRQFRRILMPASNRLVEILANFSERLDASELQAETLRKQLGYAKAHIGDLRNQLGAVRRQLDDQADFLGQIPGRLDALQAQLNDHNRQLGPIPARFADHQRHLAAHQDRLDALPAQLDDLRSRQEEHATRFPALVAFGWDYVALTRRLGALEEHVDALLSPPGMAPAGPAAADAASTPPA